MPGAKPPRSGLRNMTDAITGLCQIPQPILIEGASNLEYSVRQEGFVHLVVNNLREFPRETSSSVLQRLHNCTNHLAQAGCAMVGKCANSWCPTTRRHSEGKLFRLDIDLGSKAGVDELKTEYIWLCASCASTMHPKVVVTGNTVTLCLAKNLPARVADTNASSVRVN